MRQPFIFLFVSSGELSYGYRFCPVSFESWAEMVSEARDLFSVFGDGGSHFGLLFQSFSYGFVTQSSLISLMFRINKAGSNQVWLCLV